MLASDARSLSLHTPTPRSWPDENKPHDGLCRLLCLKCRSSGHKVSACHLEDFSFQGEDGLDWFSSEERNQFTLQFEEMIPDALCERCKGLDLVSWLSTSPPARHEELIDAYKNGNSDIFKRLGTVNDIELSERCGLCICLFGIIPTPSSHTQNIVLALSWTLHRLENSLSMDTGTKRASSRCLTTILEPLTTGSEVHRIISIESDALAIRQDHLHHSHRGLGSVRVDPLAINYQAIHRWLKTCDVAHPYSCRRHVSEKLYSIKLIDTYTRKLVPYSAETQDYLTLSYVWGGVKQEFPSAGIAGTIVPPLPRTVEDALSFTKQLSKRFLWVDSVSINQLNETEKLAQIAIMAEIYHGSYANIVALSAEHANSGISRVTSKSTSYRQLSCLLDGVPLYTLGPTLENLTTAAAWGSRAWTYQEALLTPRCIYLSDHQVYFECNSMNCCESMNETYSVVHKSQKYGDGLRSETYTQQLNLGILRNPITGKISDRGIALNVYALMTAMYSRRQMTNSSDALHAFSAILQVLQANAYPDGFYWALPCAAINWALTWQAHDSNAPRRPQFPSWSWLGHEGGVWPGGPAVGGPNNEPNVCPFDLRLSRYSHITGALETIRETFYTDLSQAERQMLKADPLANYEALACNGSLELQSMTSESALHMLLAFDSFAFRFAITQRWNQLGNENQSFYRLKVGNETLGGYTTYEQDAPLRKNEPEHLWLLLTRHVEDRRVIHNLMLLKPLRGWFERADFLRLEVPKEKLYLLESLGLHRLKGILL